MNDPSLTEDLNRTDRLASRFGFSGPFPIRLLLGFAHLAFTVGALLALRHYLTHSPQRLAIGSATVLVAFTISAWALDLFEEPLTTLLLILLAIVFRVTPASTILMGFASPAWWLVFGGAIVGIGMNTSGLGSRVSHVLLLQRPRSYRFYVSVLSLASLVLAFVMPSTTGRILLLVPIALALADRLGLTSGRPGRIGLVLSVAATSYMPTSAILPANIPNSILLGAAEANYGLRLHYGEYLWLHFPVLGVLKSVLIIAVICRMFPDRVAGAASGGSPAAVPNARQWRLGAILMVSLVLYGSDVWHGISPGWISLGAGIAYLLPGIAVVTSAEFSQQLKVTPLIYVAGFLGLGALIATSGLGALVSEALLHWVNLGTGETAVNVMLLAGIDMLVGLFTTLPGLPAVLTPMAQPFAHFSGLSLYAVLMLQVPIFSLVVLPYQSPPMMIALHLGGVPMRDSTRFCLVTASLTVIALLPLDYLWWSLLGVVQ